MLAELLVALLAPEELPEGQPPAFEGAEMPVLQLAVPEQKVRLLQPEVQEQKVLLLQPEVQEQKVLLLQPHCRLLVLLAQWKL